MQSVFLIYTSTNEESLYCMVYEYHYGGIMYDFILYLKLMMSFSRMCKLIVHTCILEIKTAINHFVLTKMYIKI